MVVRASVPHTHARPVRPHGAATCATAHCCARPGNTRPAVNVPVPSPSVLDLPVVLVLAACDDSVPPGPSRARRPASGERHVVVARAWGGAIEPVCMSRRLQQQLAGGYHRDTAAGLLAAESEGGRPPLARAQSTHAHFFFACLGCHLVASAAEPQCVRTARHHQAYDMHQRHPSRRAHCLSVCRHRRNSARTGARTEHWAARARTHHSSLSDFPFTRLVARFLYSASRPLHAPSGEQHGSIPGDGDVSFRGKTCCLRNGKALFRMNKRGDAWLMRTFVIF